MDVTAPSWQQDSGRRLRGPEIVAPSVMDARAAGGSEMSHVAKPRSSQPPPTRRPPTIPGRGPAGRHRRPPPADPGDALAREGDRRGSVAGRAARDDAGARALLGQRLRLPEVRGEAERAAAVHHGDRRPRHPLHPRQVAARERVAADHHARLAGLGHRDAERRRPAQPTRRRTAATRRTRSMWWFRRCPATGSPASRRRPAGTPSTSRTPGSR